MQEFDGDGASQAPSMSIGPSLGGFDMQSQISADPNNQMAQMMQMFGAMMAGGMQPGAGM